MIVLAGDIGATHSRLALIQAERNKVLSKKIFRSKDFETFEDLLKAFHSSEDCSLVERACFGVPGPVENGVIKTTNLPWTIVEQSISKVLGISQAWLINDLEAIASGISVLESKDFFSVFPGKPNIIGNQAVIAPGTGLGEAILVWDGNQHQPFATEGGHCDFSPTSSRQVELLQYLFKQFEHVSWERVLSGPGIFSIYNFLKLDKDLKQSPTVASKLMENDVDHAACITECALAKNGELCEQTIEFFLELLAVEAGNLALKGLAKGGLYIGGGIAPKLIGAIDPKRFLSIFVNKGRMTNILKNIPIHVILSDNAGIFGAARHAFLQ